MLYDHDTIKYSMFGEYNYTSAKIIELAMTYIYVVIYHVHNTLILHSVTLEHYCHCHDCESLIQYIIFIIHAHNCDTDHYVYRSVMIMHIYMITI